MGTSNINQIMRIADLVQRKFPLLFHCKAAFMWKVNTSSAHAGRLTIEDITKE